MIKVKGLILKEFPFHESQRIGTLLFEEYPVTDVYLSKNKPVIREWVDCNDDDNIDICFYYTVEPIKLFKFIKGEIGHRELIISNIDGHLIFTEERNSEILKQKLVTFNNVPYSYLPRLNTFVNESDIVDLKAISEKLELDKIDESDDSYNNHKAISNLFGAETYNLHIKRGKGVKYGTIDTELLGTTAIEFDKLYKELAYDTALGKNRGQISLNTNKHAELIELSKTEIFYSLASSYSLFIRPKNYSSDLFEKDSFSVSIAKNIFKLLNESQSEDKIKETYNTYSDYVISSYVDFMKQIVTNDLKLDFAWFKPIDASYYKNELSLIRANSAINNITKLSSTEKDEFEIKGKFSALNCNTGHYSFKSIHEEEYTGYFDKLIRESMVNLNFTELYKITVDRTTVKEAGKSVPTVSDEIVSHTTLEE